MKKNPLSVLPGSAAELLPTAIQAREKSYSPYSCHAVGAALRTADGKVYTGCNIENSTYGATICAERTAVLKAVSEGSRLVREIVVVTDASPPWPPCGLCLQTLAEFGAPDLKIHIVNLKKESLSYSFKDLLPQAFTSQHLITQK